MENKYKKWNNTVWYNHHSFSLIPVLIKKEKDKYNNTNYLFKWLFIKAWTRDSFDFEASIFFDSLKGFGFDIQFLYLYIEVIFIKTKFISKITELFRRKSFYEKLSNEEKILEDEKENKENFNKIINNKF